MGICLYGISLAAKSQVKSANNAAFVSGIKVLKKGLITIYRVKTWDLGEVVEVHKYHHANYGAPGRRRAMKKKRTPEDVQRVNDRNKARKVQRVIMANFRPGDWHLILRYQTGYKPNAIKAKSLLKEFLRSVRKRYKKAGIPFKYLAVTEVGKRGGVHHHLVIEDTPVARDTVRDCWKSGSTFWADLYDSEDGFMKLAEYLVKKESKERVPGSSYSASRNLKIPEPHVEKKLGKWGEPTPWEGYFVVKETVENGVNRITGRPYQRYMMRKLPPKEQKRPAVKKKSFGSKFIGFLKKLVRERGDPDGG